MSRQLPECPICRISGPQVYPFPIALWVNIPEGMVFWLVHFYQAVCSQLLEWSASVAWSHKVLFGVESFTGAKNSCTPCASGHPLPFWSSTSWLIPCFIHRFLLIINICMLLCTLVSGFFFTWKRWPNHCSLTQSDCTILHTSMLISFCSFNFSGCHPHLLIPCSYHVLFPMM